MKVNLIGGNAYCSTGGIQAVNRRLVDEFQHAGLLRSAHFLWDDPHSAPPAILPLVEAGVVHFYSLDRVKFGRATAAQRLKGRRDLWLCTHVNYGPLGWAVSGNSRRFAVMLHAAELDAEMSFMKRFALRRAGLVIAVSEFTKKKSIRLGVRPERIRVLLNAVDDPGEVLSKSEDSEESVLFVGRMDERYKGQLELLDAVSLLRRRIPSLRLVFVGGGRTLEDWKAEAERRRLTDAVTFAGRISDERLNEAYASASIFAMPSENEGFGLVYAEAMARGLPCIGSDCDAAREVILHGETGLCVPAKNATALADALYTLLRSPETRRRFGAAGRARFRAMFSAEAYRSRLLSLVHEWYGSCSLAVG